ncbi:hypothetical protein E1B28_001606 [Marasmius oreades]|uniref:Thiamin pyrophosphokinase thiamin-binding domain-containing protein n=1 Tax=Marasmius oreades TaxID=181124 RepID=A0A9P8AFL4_9AGAR|nr:uncharacterized protein E1B28_001606 [Marasmius oreades]KAG7099794.1 hypothetical protein E1B28_001606 [Marasmius oreades]
MFSSKAPRHPKSSSAPENEQNPPDVVRLKAEKPPALFKKQPKIHVICSLRCFSRTPVQSASIAPLRPCLFKQFTPDTTQLQLYLASMVTNWDVDFLASRDSASHRVLIILNQPFSFSLLDRVWRSTHWHCCADGGANRLYDVTACKSRSNGWHELSSAETRAKLIPDLIKGDLDSLRCDIQHYYASQGVPVIKDSDQDSTDLMKCINAVEDKERVDGQQYEIILLGGLAGRLDQTIHLLSFLHKLRKKRRRVLAITDDNVGWVLDEGEHHIRIDHTSLGPTCGLLPVGIDSTVLSTSGLRWNLTDHPSSFDGLVSTSNHLVPNQDVWIKTSKPIWWTVELKDMEGVTHMSNGALP